MKSRNYKIFELAVDRFIWDVAQMFPDSQKGNFIRECQGVKYWSLNDNWHELLSTRPKVGEPDLPGPRSYGDVKQPYGSVVTINLAPILHIPPFGPVPSRLPAVESSAELKGPP